MNEHRICPLSAVWFGSVRGRRTQGSAAGCRLSRVSLLPGVIRRCRALAWRAGIASDGRARTVREVRRVLEGLGRTLFEQSGVPGLSACVRFAWGEQIDLHLGRRSVAGDDPVTGETLFRALSMSKPASAICAMALVERGQLDLDAPVMDLLPSWRMDSADRGGFDPSGITVRRLLSHGAGLSTPKSPWVAVGGGKERKTSASRRLADAVDPAWRLRMLAEPGTGLHYSAGAFLLLEAIIEQVTGRGFADVAEELLLGRLGLGRASFDPARVAADRLAERHDSENRVLEESRKVWLASSGLCCTAEDLARIWEIVLPGVAGRPAGQGIVAERSARELVSPQARDADGKACGLGFYLWRRRTDTEFFHSGFSEGCWGHAEGLWSRGAVYVVLTNGDRGAGCVKPLVGAIRQCLYDLAL